MKNHKWSTTDKALFGASVVVNSIDTAQTRYILSNEDKYIEKNNLLKNRHPDFVYTFKGASLLGMFFIADNMEPVSRRVFLGATFTGVFVPVIANNSIGVKLMW